VGIFSRLGRPQASGWGPADDKWYTPGGSFYGGIGANDSGVPISPESAMRLLTVYSCVKILSESVAQLPCHLMQDIKGIKDKATKHPLYRLLHDQPNRWMTSSEFWSRVVANVALRGNFYGYKVGFPGRTVREIYPINSDLVQDVVQNSDFSLTYKIQVKNEGVKDFSQDQIFHVRGLALDGLKGLSPIEQAAQAIGVSLAGEKFIARYFGKGMHPGAVLEHPLTLSAPAHANLKKAFKEKYAGLGNSHELMLIDEGMKIQFPPIKLVDAQFLELGKFNQSQIAGMFRVPLMLLQTADNPTTFASAEQFMITFVTHALTPIVVNIEKAIYRDLLLDSEKDKNYAKFSMSGLLRGDMESRFKAYQIAINTEILNPNEVRSLEDLNPYPEGEEYRVRTSTVKQDAKAEEDHPKDVKNEL
jgi:HK97 family phage portal protein